MKEQVKTVYTCDFCKKKYFIKSACEKHETWCYHNPKNEIACFQGCMHLEEITIDIDTDYQDERQSKTFYCSKHKQTMYTLSAERRGLVERFNLLGLDQYPMPKIKCDDFEFWSF